MLTGGTMDVSPQWLKFNATQSAGDTTTTTTQAVPVIRAREGITPTIIEVLRVAYYPGNVSEVDSNVAVALGTKNFGTTAVTTTDPSLISSFTYFTKITTSGQFLANYPYVQDLTDSAGHGVLVATDNVFAQIASTTTGLTNSCAIWMLYRFKRVGTLEYVGIVQSQQ